MKITDIKQAVRNPNRVNISVDGKYRFSLDIAQITDLGIKIGNEYSDDEVVAFEAESEFGKLYARALEYCFVRPRSSKELRDYLYRKTRTTKLKNKRTGELYEKPGVSQVITQRVFDRLVAKGHVDDERFARYWIDNRDQRKGASRKKLTMELRAKGVDAALIEQQFADSERSDDDELQKVIAKKQRRYPDEQKFIQYLMRQGFRYDDIRSALAADD